MFNALAKLQIFIFVLFVTQILILDYANSDEVKKINDDLKNIKNLYQQGVLDDDSYNSAKKRLDEKKSKLLAKKNNSSKNSNSNSKTLEKQLEVIENLFKEGVLSEEEYLQTKKFLIDKEDKGENIDLNQFSEKSIPNYVLNVQKVKGNKNWEKADITFKNYKIITYRPGGIKVVRISDNKKLLQITDNYKIKYYNDGEDVIKIKKTVYKPMNLMEGLDNLDKEIGKLSKRLGEIIRNPFSKNKNKVVFDTESHKLELFIEDQRILNFVGRYVRQHRAFFYQVLSDRGEPFHFYIRLDGKSAIALNMRFFKAKIDKAVRKAKQELALEYNVSEEQIQKIIDQKIGEETNKAIEQSMESAINESVIEAIKQSIGQELSNLLVTAVEQATGEAIDSAIEQELANAIDEEIARAVAMGIDEAAVTAGWEAYFQVLAQGGTYEEANAAAYAACGSACDNY